MKHMNFNSGLPCSAMDFPVCKGVIEPASQMQEFVLPALPHLLQEPGSLNFGSISSEGLNCLTADVSPTVEQPVPQSTQQATEAKHCHNCGATETPRWACSAQCV